VSTLHLFENGYRPQSRCRLKQRHNLALEVGFEGSGRRRPRGWRLQEGNPGSASSRAPVLVLKPALAAAVSRLCISRSFIYNFACWSVMCRSALN
jgi:hypothetical protein